MIFCLFLVFGFRIKIYILFGGFRMVTMKSETTGSYLFSKVNTFKDGSSLRQVNVLFGDDVVSFYTQLDSDLANQCNKLVTGSFINCELEFRLFNGNWKPRLLAVAPAKV